MVPVRTQDTAKKINVMLALNNYTSPGPISAANAAETSSKGLALGEFTGVHSGVGGHNIVGKSRHSAKFASVSQSADSEVPLLRHSAKLASVSQSADSGVPVLRHSAKVASLSQSADSGVPVLRTYAQSSPPRPAFPLPRLRQPRFLGRLASDSRGPACHILFPTTCTCSSPAASHQGIKSGALLRRLLAGAAANPAEIAIEKALPMARCSLRCCSDASSARR